VSDVAKKHFELMSTVVHLALELSSISDFIILLSFREMCVLCTGCRRPNTETTIVIDKSPLDIVPEENWQWLVRLHSALTWTV